MITKAEAVAKLSTRDETRLGMLTQEIDARLLDYDGQPVTVTLGSESRKVIEEVKRLYGAGGWTVTVQEGSQREPERLLRFA